MKRNLIALCIAVALLLISIKFFPYHCNCQARTAGVSTSTTYVSGPSVTIDGKTLAVDVAGTEREREQGLSGRTGLCADCAMLFIFPNAGRPGFWMKDMNFSLDIVWIGPEKHVTGVLRRLSPATYPQIYFPSAATEYVLEMPAGEFDRHGFQIGDAVEINL